MAPKIVIKHSKRGRTATVDGRRLTISKQRDLTDRDLIALLIRLVTRLTRRRRRSAKKKEIDKKTGTGHVISGKDVDLINRQLKYNHDMGKKEKKSPDITVKALPAATVLALPAADTPPPVPPRDTPHTTHWKLISPSGQVTDYTDDEAKGMRDALNTADKTARKLQDKEKKLKEKEKEVADAAESHRARDVAAGKSKVSSAISYKKLGDAYVNARFANSIRKPRSPARVLPQGGC
eukprot:TRINITY_DN34973_c0_g1_i1.p1 TRINITY_DN34973_c0_g1~~TRINITY_DN34973_c0_g1_i1.p1  ORF type:complete len:236 (+),score=67.53 TRINITY_DN34973_c0_g1_i1:42-749(+)